VQSSPQPAPRPSGKALREISRKKWRIVDSIYTTPQRPAFGDGRTGNGTLSCRIHEQRLLLKRQGRARFLNPVTGVAECLAYGNCPDDAGRSVLRKVGPAPVRSAKSLCMLFPRAARSWPLICCTEGKYATEFIGGHMRLKTLFIAGVLFVNSVGIASAQECYESSIRSPSPFMGNNGEIFRLADGSLWEVKYEYGYLYEYYPSVIICPSRGKLAINGKSLNVEQVGGRQPARKPQLRQATPAEVIESQIDGEFSGWDGETIFKLTNGQIWQQAAYAYTYTYKYRPKVLVFRSSDGYQMQVEGMDNRIWVTRLR
jgi:hypothetical protein